MTKCRRLSMVVLAVLWMAAPQQAHASSVGATGGFLNGNPVTDRAPKGLSDSDWSSIRKEHLRHRQAAFAVAGGWRAHNYRQDWSAFFDGRGFEVTPGKGSWRWGLRLAAYGYSGQERSVGVARPAADVEKFSYQWDSILREWYVNGDGLEHGYTLAARPGKGTGLRLLLEVRGTLESRIAADGRSVAFLEHGGGPAVVNYSGLKVTDASGRELGAHFVGEGRRLRLDIDDDEAVYPITVDPIAQQAYLKASNPDNGDGFGYSVAVDGDIAVVGAPIEHSNGSSQADNSLNSAGAAYVFTRGAQGVWSQQAWLKASNPDAFDNFGYSVAVSGTTVVVGAWGEDSANPLFQDNNNRHDSGAVYVFTRVAGTWAQQAYLKARFIGADDHFSSVAIGGDTIVVGAFEEDAEFPNSGAAYVFTRSGLVWTQQAYLKAPLPWPGVNFGFSVAVSGDTVVVGEPREFVNGLGARAYVFTRTGGVWTWQASLLASNRDPNDQFGFSVAISADTVVVGAYGEDSNGSSQSDNSLNAAGAAYVFTRLGTIWTQQAFLKASNATAFNQFGYSVSLAGDTVVVGDPGTTGPGAAYVFARSSGGMWYQQDILNASNADFGDQFGYSVAVSGDTAVVGAHQEDSDGTSPSNNSARDAGAAYVFVIPPPPPPTVNITLTTAPQGLVISTGGTGCGTPGNYTTPVTLQWVPGSTCSMSVSFLQSALRFTHWEDNSTNIARSITVPGAAFTFAAYFGANVTLVVTPSGAGTVTGFKNGACAAVCTGIVDAASPPTFTATSGGSYTFGGWTGDCTGTSPCALKIDKSDLIVVANFSPPKTTLTAGLGIKSGPQNARMWPIVFTNTGPGSANGIEITGVAVTPPLGSSCSPHHVGFGMVGTIPGSGTLPANVTIDFTGCAASTRFRLVVNYTFNSGISQTLILNNQLR